MNSIEEVFDAVKERMVVSDTAMRLWIAPLKAIEMTENTFLLYSKEPYIRKVAVETFGEQIQKRLAEVMGFDVDLEILVDSEMTIEQKAKMGVPIPELQDDPDMISKLTTAEQASIYQYTFDTFIVGESNKLAFSACRNVAKGETGAYNPLYIYSQPGLGKTHLLNAVSSEIERGFPHLKIVFVTSETFVDDFVESVKNGTNQQFRDKYRTADMLLIDDVQFFSGKKESQAELFNTFNELHSRGKQILFTSDRSPKEIMDIEVRLRTRFEWGLLADIGLPAYETRLAIIKRKAELIKLDIPQNVMEFMAEKLKDNIRQLEGAIIKMHAMSSINDSSPTILMAQNIIREVLTEQQPIPITVEKIIGEVANIYSVSKQDIRSQNRTSSISTARQVAIFVVHQLTNLSYTAIGHEFGDRDHSTIVYAIKKVRDLFKKDPSFKGTVDDIIRNIGNLNN